MAEHCDEVTWADMTDNQWKEQVSLAYARAVAVASGGQIIGPREIDDGCIDLSIEWAESDAGVPNIAIDLQLKCTADPREGEPDTLKHSVDRRTWSKLTSAVQKPHLFVVMVVPTAHREASIEWTPGELRIRRGAYWIELDPAQHPFPADQGSMTVALPKRNVFSPAALVDLRERTAAALLEPVTARADEGGDDGHR